MAKMLELFNPRVRVLVSIVLNFPAVGMWTGILIYLLFGIQLTSEPVAGVVEAANASVLHTTLNGLLPTLALVLTTLSYRKLKPKDRRLGTLSIILSGLLLTLFRFSLIRSS
jgi:hypothetical protein